MIGAESGNAENPKNRRAADRRYRQKRKLEDRVRAQISRLWDEDELIEDFYGADAAEIRSDQRLNDQILDDMRQALSDGIAEVEEVEERNIGRVFRNGADTVAELRRKLTPGLDDELERDPALDTVDVVVEPGWLRPRPAPHPRPTLLSMRWYIAKRALDFGREPAEFAAKHGRRGLTAERSIVVVELLDEWGASRAGIGRAFGGRTDRDIAYLERQGRKRRRSR